MLLGELDHRGVDLHLGETLHRPVLEHLLGDAAIPAADDQNILGLTMGEQRYMRHHLLIDEFVLFGDLRRAVEHQHLAEEPMLEQYEMLVLSLQLIQHPVDFKGHAKSEIVEQRFRYPALPGQIVARFVFLFGSCQTPAAARAQWWPSSAIKPGLARPGRVTSGLSPIRCL